MILALLDYLENRKQTHTVQQLSRTWRFVTSLQLANIYFKIIYLASGQTAPLKCNYREMMKSKGSLWIWNQKMKAKEKTAFLSFSLIKGQVLALQRALPKRPEYSLLCMNITPVYSDTCWSLTWHWAGVWMERAKKAACPAHQLQSGSGWTLLLLNLRAWRAVWIAGDWLGRDVEPRPRCILAAALRQLTAALCST